MNRVSKFLAACALTITAFSAQAADLEAGQKIADAPPSEQVCAACHGADGNSVASANPSLAGQHAKYLESQLKAFKSGERKNPIMAGLAKPLSRQDIDNLAAYFGSLPGPLTHKR